MLAACTNGGAAADLSAVLQRYVLVPPLPQRREESQRVGVDCTFSSSAWPCCGEVPCPTLHTGSSNNTGAKAANATPMMEFGVEKLLLRSTFLLRLQARDLASREHIYTLVSHLSSFASPFFILRCRYASPQLSLCFTEGAAPLAKRHFSPARASAPFVSASCTCRTRPSDTSWTFQRHGNNSAS